MDMVETPSSREVMLKHVSDSKLNKKFTFDRTFGQDSKQVRKGGRLQGTINSVLMQFPFPE